MALQIRGNNRRRADGEFRDTAVGAGVESRRQAHNNRDCGHRMHPGRTLRSDEHQSEAEQFRPGRGGSGSDPQGFEARPGRSWRVDCQLPLPAQICR